MILILYTNHIKATIVSEGYDKYILMQANKQKAKTKQNKSKNKNKTKQNKNKEK